MDTTSVREGMTVYSKDGKKLGKIIEREGDTLVIEKGLFFKKDYVATLADVDRVKDDEVWLQRNADEIETTDDDQATRAIKRQGASREAGQGMSASAAADQTSSPGAEDEDEDVVVVVEEEVIAVAPADEDQPGMGAPGRGPTPRR
jgi:hypothetical protein